MLVIPAIDIMDGKCVRLFQGNFAKVKEYSLNPVEQAKFFADMGLEHLHLIDLDGAKSGSPTNLNVLEQVAKSTPLKVDFGGGLRSVSSIIDALNAGAWKVNIGSLLTQNLDTSVVTKIPKEKVIAAVDCENSWVKTLGWQNRTAIKVDVLLTNLAGAGFTHFTITDIARDGTLTGPALALYDNLRQKFPTIKLWASGGISSLFDIINLKDIKVDGAIVGKAYYENKLNLKEVLKCLQNE